MSNADAGSSGLGPLWDFDQQLVVEVRNRFDGSWSHGFEIVEQVTTEAGAPKLRLRRLSDGVVLPALFSADDVVVRANTPRIVE